MEIVDFTGLSTPSVCACGSQAKVVKYFINGVANKVNYFVKCQNCLAKTRDRKHLSAAITEWNTFQEEREKAKILRDAILAEEAEAEDPAAEKEAFWVLSRTYDGAPSQMSLFRKQETAIRIMSEEYESARAEKMAKYSLGSDEELAEKLFTGWCNDNDAGIIDVGTENWCISMCEVIED